MKNKGVLILASLFILSLIGISFYGGPVTYVFFITILMIPVISYLYILCVIISLKIYQRTDGRDMVSGTPSDFYITLQNEGLFSFSSLRIIFYSSFSEISEIDDGVVYELPPHSSILKRTKLLCRYRGEYNVGVEKIVVGDFLGIFSVTYRIREPLSVIVSPAIVHINDIGESRMMIDSDRDDPRKKTEPDIPLRDYADGDDIRFINWKATSLMQKLMVRESHGEEKSGVVIVMDPLRFSDDISEYLPAENKVIELVLALSLYFMENNIPVDVLYDNGEPEKLMIRNAGDYETLYAEMKGFHFRSDAGLINFSRNGRPETGLGGYRMMIVICPQDNDSVIESAQILRTDEVPMRIYMVSNDTDIVSTADDRSGRTEVISVGTEPLSEVAL